jgi:DNA-binding transcriptional ArsR family regulator
LAPLGKGFLTGTIKASTSFDASNDIRSTIPRFTPEALQHNQAMVDLLASIAQRKGATPGQMALSWLLAQKPWIVPIPGTRKLHRLEENIGAADVELSADEIAEIEDAASKIEVQGGRYHEAHERMTISDLPAFASVTSRAHPMIVRHQEAGAATGSSAAALLATARLTRMPAIIATPKSARALMPCSHPRPATEWANRPSATWSTVSPSTISAHLMPPGTLAKNELIKSRSERAGRMKMPPVACHENPV